MFFDIPIIFPKPIPYCISQDLRGEIARINDHLGRPISPDKLDKVTELASFSGMKKSYADSDKREEEKAATSGESKPEKIIPSDRYLRKGEICICTVILCD